MVSQYHSPLAEECSAPTHQETEHCSYMLSKFTISPQPDMDPPPPAANAINMLRHPSSIRQCPAGLRLHQPTIDSLIWGHCCCGEAALNTSASSTDLLFIYCPLGSCGHSHGEVTPDGGTDNSADETPSRQVDYITWRNQAVCILYSSIKVLCDAPPIRS